MLHSTFKFHHPYFLSGVLVVTCVLPRAEPAVSTHDNAYMDGTDTARRQNGFVMAQRASAQGVVHPIRNRIIESFWSMQSAQTDLLHAAARCGVLGDNCNLGDFETHPNCPESENKLHCGRVVQVAQLHPPLGAAWSTGPAYSSGTRALRHRR